MLLYIITRDFWVAQWLYNSTRKAIIELGYNIIDE